MYSKINKLEIIVRISIFLLFWPSTRKRRIDFWKYSKKSIIVWDHLGKKASNCNKDIGWSWIKIGHRLRKFRRSNSSTTTDLLIFVTTRKHFWVNINTNLWEILDFYKSNISDDPTEAFDTLIPLNSYFFQDQIISIVFLIK